jgi:enhancing lycopene biosynthesis protein 2
MSESRNVLIEAARIARGAILPIAQASINDLDALIVPGGFGAAKNLSSFASLGSECVVDPDLKRLVLEMHQAGKPLGFICIAPAMLPKIFDFPLRLTIGTDIDTAEVLEDMGAEHVPCPVDDIVVDEDNKVVTTPAYMLAQNIAEAATGSKNWSLAFWCSLNERVAWPTHGENQKAITPCGAGAGHLLGRRYSSVQFYAGAVFSRDGRTAVGPG